jgi:hypothetical protein
MNRMMGFKRQRQLDGLTNELMNRWREKIKIKTIQIKKMTDKQRNRETDKQTDGQTNRRTGRQTD